MNTTPPVNGATRIRPGRRTSLRQVLDLQEITHAAALGLRDDFAGTKDRDERARIAGAIASLGKSLCSLQDTKREILGRPKAGVLKPEQPKAKRTGQPQYDLKKIAEEMAMESNPVA